MAEQGQPNRRLAGPGLANKPKHLAGGDVKGDLVDDVDSAPRHLDAQVLDLENCAGRLVSVETGRPVGHRCAHRSPPRSIPAAARAKPSPMRLVPMVRSAMATTGSTTPHGCT